MRRPIFRTAAVLAIGLSGACSNKEGGTAKEDSTQAKGAEPTAVTITTIARVSAVDRFIIIHFIKSILAWVGNRPR